MDRTGIEYGNLDDGSVNYWRDDPTLRAAVRRAYPDEEFEWAAPLLSEFGAAVGEEIGERSDVIDRHEPELHTYDAEGEVCNRVEYHPLQFETERLAYEDFRLTHDAFHAPPDRDEPVGRIHPLTLQTLLCYVDVGFACPASMTVGAAIVLEKFADDDRLDRYLAGLTTDDHEAHIEGAMFLTEQQGGSDVGANEVRAEPQGDGTYELHGEKWFCSNIDAQGALALARTPDAPDGTDGLSLFLVPRERPDGSLNDAVFRRLKDKLGTLSVPTGEIEFEGATAYRVGSEERGFRYMTEMLNYERLTNATGAIGVVGRALLAAKRHAATREAFGNPIQEYPLLRRDLVELTVDYEAAAAFAFEAARWYDRRERAYPDDEDTDAYRLMRLLVPIAKYRTGKLAVRAASEAMEIRGGDGYVREQVTERLLRDAQVLPIWEGTSNILSLDVLRALRTVDAHEALFPLLEEYLDDLSHPVLESAGAVVEERAEALQGALVSLASADEETAEYHAKRLADLTYDVLAAALLLSMAQTDVDERADARRALVARWFVADRFESAPDYGIAGGDRPGDRHFDAIARYESVDPTELPLIAVDEP